jgi:hypothetical protein
VTAWHEGSPLAKTTGCAFAYQSCPENTAALAECVAEHWRARQKNTEDKGLHGLVLAMASPGSGKSRLLDEALSLIRSAVSTSSAVPDAERAAVMERLRDALVFKLSFENGSSADPFINPEHSLAARMLKQLLPDRAFSVIRNQVQAENITPAHIFERLADIKQVPVADLTVLLLCDSLQEMEGAGDVSNPDSKFGKVVKLCAQIGNTSGSKHQPFCIPFCAATVLNPALSSLWASSQKRVRMLFPGIDASQIFIDHSRGPYVELVVDDMAGHPRALEHTFIAFSRYPECVVSADGATIEIGPLAETFKLKDFMLQVRTTLSVLYSTDLMGWRQIFLALLTGKTFASERDDLSHIGVPGRQLFEFLQTGFMRLDTETRRLICPQIWVWLIASKDLVLNVLLEDLYDLTQSFYSSSPAPASTRWYEFERFTALFWCIKTELFQEGWHSWGDLHYGAKLASKNTRDVKVRVRPLTLVQASRQYATKSSLVVKIDEVQCERATYTMTAEFKHHVVSAANNPGGDSFCRIKTDQEERVTFVMSNKCVAGKRTLEDFCKEREKACDANDFFIEYTTSETSIAEGDLEPRCGLVDKGCFEQYFGPFASRVWRLAATVPINTATRAQLMTVDGIGEVLADEILDVRRAGPFANIGDARKRLPGVRVKVLYKLRFF